MGCRAIPLLMIADSVPLAHPRARQVSVGLVVAGLHVLGVLAWWTLERGVQSPRNGLVPDPITVWLPRLVTPFAERDKRVARKETPPPQRSPLDATPRRNSEATLAEPPIADAAAAPPSPQSAAVQAPTAPASALNLTLSRKALAPLAAPSFADKSPFHRRLPATVEQQVALAFAEAGPWAEERIDDDHIRFRRGNTCVIVQRPRAATIDPFSEAAGRIPWRATEPQACQ